MNKLLKAILCAGMTLGILMCSTSQSIMADGDSTVQVIQEGTLYWIQYSDGSWCCFDAVTGPKVGWFLYHGNWYYLDESGNMVTGWAPSGGKLYYLGDNGIMVTGWQTIDGQDYYFDESGALDLDVTNAYQKVTFEEGWKVNCAGTWYQYEDGSFAVSEFKEINGETVYFNDDGYMVYYWALIDGSWYYFDAVYCYEEDYGGYILYGSMLTGWLGKDGEAYFTSFTYQDTNTYYFGEDGIMVTGWQTIDGEKYYFNASGALVTLGGWKKNSTGWWYESADGTYPASEFKVIDGKTYYFNSNGYMVTGWKEIDDTWYYFNGSGAMMTGWIQSSNVWYFMNEDGTMHTGLLDDNGTKYFLKDSGAMLTGWKELDDTWYYFGSSGAMVTNGWAKSGNSWYYLGSDGEMVTNEWIDGKYFVSDSGQMVTYAYIHEGDKYYWVNSSGAYEAKWTTTTKPNGYKIVEYEDK